MKGKKAFSKLLAKSMINPLRTVFSLLLISSLFVIILFVSKNNSYKSSLNILINSINGMRVYIYQEDGSHILLKYPEELMLYKMEIPGSTKPVTVLSNEKVESVPQLSSDGFIVAFYTSPNSKGSSLFGGTEFYIDGEKSWRLNSQANNQIVSGNYTIDWLDQVFVSEQAFSIKLITRNADTLQKNRDLFEKILSTIRFLN